jgi:FkbM family methyltransferase
VAEPLGEGLLALRFADGVVVGRSPWTPSPRALQRETLDTFCWWHTPEPGDVVLDIGAGAGEEAPTFSALVGPRGTVVCVEAHPTTFAQLAACCRLNGLANVRCEMSAVADVTGSVRIARSGPSHVGATIQNDSGIEVRAETVDDLVERLGLERIDLLKMNVEGAERLAIQAMDGTMTKTEHLVISCHDFLVPLFDADPEQVMTFVRVKAFLMDHGFEVVTRPYDARPWIPYYVYAHRPG